MVMQAGGSAALLSSVFEFNFAANSTDGYGIVNFDGRVQCDRFGFGCQNVCTICCRERLCRDDDDDDDASDSKTQSNRTSHAEKYIRLKPVRLQPLSAATVVICLMCSGLCLLAIIASRGYRGYGICAALIRAEHSHGVELYTVLPVESGDNDSPASNAATYDSVQETNVEEEIVRLDEGESEHTANAADDQRPFKWPGNRERSIITGLPQSLPWAVMEASSAPMFVIGRSDKGFLIKLCSTGMSKTVPMHVDPVGRFLTDLPFVNAHEGAECRKKVESIFEAPAEHDKSQTLMLHLCVPNGTVLLEMTLGVFVTASESIIVMTGREVESGLAGLLRNHNEGPGTSSGLSAGTPSEPGIRTPTPSEPDVGM